MCPEISADRNQMAYVKEAVSLTAHSPVNLQAEDWISNSMTVKKCQHAKREIASGIAEFPELQKRKGITAISKLFGKVFPKQSFNNTNNPKSDLC